MSYSSKSDNIALIEWEMEEQQVRRTPSNELILFVSNYKHLVEFVRKQVRTDTKWMAQREEQKAWEILSLVFVVRLNITIFLLHLHILPRLSNQSSTWKGS